MATRKWQVAKGERAYWQKVGNAEGQKRSFEGGPNLRQFHRGRVFTLRTTEHCEPLRFAVFY
jgi:hypothetical protein